MCCDHLTRKGKNLLQIRTIKWLDMKYGTDYYSFMIHVTNVLYKKQKKIRYSNAYLVLIFISLVTNYDEHFSNAYLSFVYLL